MPEHNAKDIPTFPELSWNTIEKADFYHLQLAEYGSETFIIDDSTITPPAEGEIVDYTVENELDGLKMYKWHVCGLNVGGRGPWSEFRIFTTWDPTEVLDNNTSVFHSTIAPNPLTDKAVIKFELKESSQVEIYINNISGLKVLNLIEGNFEAGIHNLPVNLNSLQSGIYFYTIKTNGLIENKGFIIAK